MDKNTIYKMDNNTIEAVPKIKIIQYRSQFLIRSYKTQGFSLKSLEFDFPKIGAEHHTSNYQQMKRHYKPSLVVRRGLNIDLVIKTSRPYNPNEDYIMFSFRDIDDDSCEIATINLLHKKSTLDDWGGFIRSSKGDTLNICLYIPHDCPLMRLSTHIHLCSNNFNISYNIPLTIYVLCNPWHPKDQVYLKNEEERKEYVLEDKGLIWLRPTNYKEWKYGQFGSNILDCAFYLINEVGRMKCDKNDLVEVVRALSATVNKEDDDGVLYGEWNTFNDGIHPVNWNGSGEILQQYYNTKKPVKYGQCWIFSGVLTTVFRALGIPSRPVTNFSSAVDKNSSLTLDTFIDSSNTNINTKIVSESMTKEFVWNFHVWTEVWMQRPDLGDVYSGWQALDGTPEQQSDGMYRCGPASVNAVKLGDILLPYDTQQFYAEVNADEICWQYNELNELEILEIDDRRIGRKISTKAVGKDKREDITDNYKYSEGTVVERTVMKKALGLTNNKISKLYLEELNKSFSDLL